MPAVEETERFADVVVRDPLPLDEACTLIGAHADPSCDVEATLARLDDLAADVAGDVAGDLAGDAAGADIDALLATLFGRHGFTGDQSSYYDPRNSYLHDVLERRRGIPITLSVVLMEVGRRVGVDLDGIGTPAHFMVRHPGPSDRWIDAFGGGRVLDRGELVDLFAVLAPGVSIEPYLEPLPAVEIVRRILANLVGVHQRRGDRDALLWSTQLRTLLPGTSPDDRRSFGGALAAAGDFARAAKVLESIVADGRASDPERELTEAKRLRARLN